MILLVALVFTAACVASSGKRLRYAIATTAIDPSRLAAGMRELALGPPPDRLRALAGALVRQEGVEWERDVVRAAGETVETRAALLGEAMTELDFLARRWARVPRVCASLSSSFGFLLATIALRVGLSDLVGTLDPTEVVSVNAAVLDAVDVAAVGLVGTAFCIAIEYGARSAVLARLAGAERLIEVLDPADGGALVGAGLRARVVAAPESEAAVPSIP